MTKKIAVRKSIWDWIGGWGWGNTGTSG